MPRRVSFASARWPLALLLASIALTAVAVINAQRTLRSNRALAEGALRDYASFGVWSYQQHLRVALEQAVHEALGAVNHGDEMHTSPNVPWAEELAHYLPWDDRCACHRTRRGPTPAAFYAFRIGDDSLDVALSQFAEPHHGWLTDEGDFHRERVPGLRYAAERPLGPSGEERAWIHETLAGTIREGVPTQRRFGIVAGEWRGAARLLAYTLMPTTRGDTLVYATEYRPADVEALLARTLEAEGLLPATFTRGRTNRDVLALEVLDPRGRALFRSAPDVDWALDARSTLPASHGSLVVHARIHPEVADALVIGGVPRSRLPFLLGLLALAAALSVVAVAQLRREGELSRLRADFVANVSHELRTPLAQIRLWLETLRLGRFTEPAQRERTLEILDRETRRLAHLVENVLRFSRDGRTDHAPREIVDASEEAASVAAEFAPLAAARGVTIDVSTPGPTHVRVRAGALRQVLLNLLDNAVKYGPDGQTVQLRVAGIGERVRLTIADRGHGVPAAEREAVWRPFERGSQAARSGVGGSGIGLTVIREIVAEHDGRAWVEDAPGGGAAFVVELPRHDDGTTSVADRQAETRAATAR
jgi:signal transduction histidine kinase